MGRRRPPVSPGAGCCLAPRGSAAAPNGLALALARPRGQGLKLRRVAVQPEAVGQGELVPRADGDLEGRRDGEVGAGRTLQETRHRRAPSSRDSPGRRCGPAPACRTCSRRSAGRGSPEWRRWRCPGDKWQEPLGLAGDLPAQDEGRLGAHPHLTQGRAVLILHRQADLTDVIRRLEQVVGIEQVHPRGQVAGRGMGRLVQVAADAVQHLPGGCQAAGHEQDEDPVRGWLEQVQLAVGRCNRPPRWCGSRRPGPGPGRGRKKANAVCHIGSGSRRVDKYRAGGGGPGGCCRGARVTSVRRHQRLVLTSLQILALRRQGPQPRGQPTLATSTRRIECPRNSTSGMCLSLRVDLAPNFVCPRVDFAITLDQRSVARTEQQTCCRSLYRVVIDLRAIGNTCRDRAGRQRARITGNDLADGHIVSAFHDPHRDALGVDRRSSVPMKNRRTKKPTCFARWMNSILSGIDSTVSKARLRRSRMYSLAHLRARGQRPFSRHRGRSNRRILPGRCNPG